MTIDKCLLCGHSASVYTTGKATNRIEDCPKCGDYEISWPLALAIQTKGSSMGTTLAFLSAHTRQLTESGSDVQLTTDNYAVLAAGHRSTGVTTKLDRVVRYLANRSSRPGDKVQVGPDDYPLFDCVESAEVTFLLETLREQGALKEVTGSRWVVTAEGWARVSPSGGGGTPNTCFVAMSFDPTLDAAYDNGIRPAVEKDSGMSVVRVDRVEHNGVVTDLILASIRSAQLVIADVTFQRTGVYFEAGFALGLGKTVIWCCRKDDLANVHFDTRQYSHIVWESTEELRSKLANRIRATVLSS